MLTFEPVTALLAALRGQELAADVDPSELNLPGAWVTVDQITTANVAGTERLEVSVYLIAADQDHMRAMEGLAALYNLAAAVIRPDGPVRPTAVVMPGDPTPLPALRVPVYLYESE
jgi:hypothetical protein